MPWSPGIRRDDLVVSEKELTASCLLSVNYDVLEKMDGECTTIYPDGYVHARSVDSKHHPSRSYLKQIAANICYKMPEDHIICGENLFAEHSIRYDNLESFFQVFGIFQYHEINGFAYLRKLSYDQQIEFIDKYNLGLTSVRRISTFSNGFVLDQVKKNRCLYDAIHKKGFDKLYPDSEGYVLHPTSCFSFVIDDNMFLPHVYKYVRANHVQTDQHWTEHWKQNSLRKDIDD